MRTFLAAVILGLVALPVAAQQDPREAIKEIVTRVDQHLQEIDKLLRESSKPDQKSGATKPAELLQQSQQKSEQVEQGISDLIEKLKDMANQQGGGQGSQDQQQQQQQGEQQGQQKSQGNRQENQTPDYMDQGQRQQQQGQDQNGQQPKPQNQQQGQQPTGPEKDPKSLGQNQQNPMRPQDETAPGQPGQGVDEWGELQSYQNFLKNRGSMPKVPERFRKYWEAYLQSKQKKQ